MVCTNTSDVNASLTAAPTLWPHQTAAAEATLAAIQSGKRSGLVVMPTGVGKTALFVSIARRLGWPAMVMVHRDELVRQTVATLWRFWPDAVSGVIQAERDEWDDSRDVVIASVQSLHARRLERMPGDRFRLLIADEAHHSVAPTWQAVIEHFDHDFLFGCTATPDRTDGEGLADLFGRQPLFTYPLRQAIEDGRLVRIIQYAVKTGADLDRVQFRGGDFAESALGAAVNTAARNNVVVEAFQEHASDRRAIVFAANVAHARSLCGNFQGAGIEAAIVTGKTPRDERREILRSFAAGDIQVLCNCEVLVEGFDDPGVSCVLMARPTASRSLYTQCVGRSLRLAPNKSDALILDFTDNSRKHKLITMLDLLGAPRAEDAAGRDAIEVADEDRQAAEAANVIQSNCPVEWRLASVSPWPELPTLNGYVSHAY